MRPLRFTLNITLDGCYDHRVGIADEDLHRHAMESIQQADALLFGRLTYQMMEEAWRLPVSWPMPDWMMPFAKAMDAAKKYVVSNTLKEVAWNTELVRASLPGQGDLATFVQHLKQQPGKGIGVAGAKLAFALTELGLIDEYEFLIHPRLAGHGPTLFAGLSKIVDLKLVDRKELGSGVVVLRYEVKR
jgi:dihydrofolate reductase